MKKQRKKLKKKLRNKRDRELVRIILKIDSKLNKNNYSYKKFNQLMYKKNTAEEIIKKRLMPTITYSKLFIKLDPEQKSEEKYLLEDERAKMSSFLKEEAKALGLTEDEAQREVEDWLNRSNRRSLYK